MKEKLWERADFVVLTRGMSDADRKKRHDIRYACFRMQTHHLGGVKPEKGHLTIAKKIEKMSGFEGWKKFAITWDVSEVSPVKLVQRKWSIHEEWTQTMKRVSDPLPGTKDGRESNI